ncbi:MAG: ABC transporter permease [Anaerolineaceae bacterium]|nr:ABC transporter permease [Anaerolineaceae bacterium]
MDFIFSLQLLLQATLRMATPLVLAGIGETFSERAGVINIGLEGYMLIGAFAAYTTVFYTDNLFLAILAAVLVTVLFGIAFAYFTITVKANQIIAGAVLNIIGLGISGYLYRILFAQTLKASAVRTFQQIPIPLLKDIPLLGPTLFDQNILVYSTYLLVPLAAIILYKTSLGLVLRATGEHPHAVESLGIRVIHIRYGAVIFAAMLAGIGGAYLSIAYANQFVENMTAGRGFIALAMVAFGQWNPIYVWLAGLLFGSTFGLQLRLQAGQTAIPYQFLQILPYVVTFIALIISHGRSMQPKAMGIPFEKEGN